MKIEIEEGQYNAISSHQLRFDQVPLVCMEIDMCLTWLKTSGRFQQRVRNNARVKLFQRVVILCKLEDNSYFVNSIPTMHLQAVFSDQINCVYDLTGCFHDFLIVITIDRMRPDLTISNLIGLNSDLKLLKLIHRLSAL